MRSLAVSTLLAMTFCSTLSIASEVSLVSGFLRNEKSKLDGEDNGGKNVIEVGGRYAEPLSKAMHWYGQGMLSLKSFDAPDGGKAPSDSTSIQAIGGIRLYFGDFSTSVAPFIAAAGGYVSSKDADPVGTAWVETETSGLFYYGFAGFRFDCDSQFFLDIETTLFESALFATETEQTVGDDDSKRETRRMDLYVSSAGSMFETTFGVGMRL